MNFKGWIIIACATVLSLFGAVIYTVQLMNASQERVAAAQLQRFESSILAYQLRQSSDDLTRMVRTYALTGDTHYKQYFFEILAIREGKSPRPLNYEKIYWDQVTSSDSFKPSLGPAVSLLTLMIRAGVSAQELEKLEEAKRNSDQLTVLEQEAFAAMEGRFLDNSKEQYILREPDPAYAVKILHSREYHHAKAEIMQPIGEFMRMLNARTLREVDAARLQTQSSLRGIFLVLAIITAVLALVLSLIFARLKLNASKLSKKNQQLTVKTAEIEQQNNTINQASHKLQKHANEMELANRHKSEFLACMSHEIRTPMNGVIGMLSLLQKSKLDKEQEHRAAMAQSSAKSLLALINDILDFSKVDAGKLELEILDFNLAAMLREFAQSMALRVEEKGLELILDAGNLEQISVKGDSGRLRQILTNLVSNAIKFTAAGEIVIRAKLSPMDNNEISFRCSVEDTGIGIPADKQSTLFEVFTQVDASTTRRYGGTGLGLSICQKLCQLMGGTISTTSEAGKGSCFNFNVKLQASQQEHNKLPTINIETLSILIVDDNKTNREVLRSQLALWGASVNDADSAAAALQYLESLPLTTGQPPVELAIIDMQMPLMDGVQLAEKLRQDSRFNGIKLMMMTSMASRGDANFYAQRGFSAYFPKPVMPCDLHNALAVLQDNGSALLQAQPLVTSYYLQSLQQDQKPLDLPPLDSNQNAAIGWPDNVRLLMVDDNPINLEVAQGMLEDMGLSASMAADGKEALHALAAAPADIPYSLVLLDCQMPEMNGYEASKNIRAGVAGKRYQQLPIVAMTANAMLGDKEQCLAAGMSDYLSKPIDPDTLKNMLSKWLLPSAEEKNQNQDTSSDSISDRASEKTDPHSSGMG